MSPAGVAAVAFSCPWCPLTVVGFGDSVDDARRLIEHHLDEHLSAASAPAIPQPRQPPAPSRTTSSSSGRRTTAA